MILIGVVGLALIMIYDLTPRSQKMRQKLQIEVA